MPFLFRVATIQQRDKTGSGKTSLPTANKPVSCEFTTKNKHVSSSGNCISGYFICCESYVKWALRYMQFVTVPVFLGASAAAPPGLC